MKNYEKMGEYDIVSEKRFTYDEEGNILDYGDILTVEEVLEYLNEYRRDMLRFSVENEQLEQKVKEKNEYQQVLEAKIRRLKNRIKILEKAEGWQN